MEKFDFLLGTWDMEYHIPESSFSDAASGTGRGEFQRALDDKYVFFDYSTLIDGKKGRAHAIFVRDEKAGIYRFWWFESSGSFMKATCDFIDDETLFINWHDSLLRQTFKKIDRNKVVLRIENPNSEGEYELVLEVLFTGK